jgi:hypothetical protein
VKAALAMGSAAVRRPHGNNRGGVKTCGIWRSFLYYLVEYLQRYISNQQKSLSFSKTWQNRFIEHLTTALARSLKYRHVLSPANRPRASG